MNGSFSLSASISKNFIRFRNPHKNTQFYMNFYDFIILLNKSFPYRTFNFVPKRLELFSLDHFNFNRPKNPFQITEVDGILF